MNPAALISRVTALRKLKQQRSAQRRATEEPKARPPLDLSKSFTPNPGPQTEFWNSECYEVLYGGAAGGGKSIAATMLPLRWLHIPGFTALTLRRVTGDLRDLLSKADEWYPKVGLNVRRVLRKGIEELEYPGGGTLLWGHCADKKDHAKYDGWEPNLVIFDELTHFTEKQYTYICARIRTSKPGFPTYVRATSNPGGEGHDWVFKRWGAWLNPDFEAEGLPSKAERGVDKNGKPLPPAKPGEVWWVRTVKGVETYYREKPELTKPSAISRTFIPASLSDTPQILENDPEYASRLENLDAVRRDQLLDGNWLAKPAAGLYFKKIWCLFVEKDDIPKGAIYVRFWDRAATEKTDDNDPDWTVGVLMARHNSTYWVVDRVKGQWSPGKVDAIIEETTRLDAENYGGETQTIVAQDPGQAGKAQAQQTVRSLAGFRVGYARETGSKLARFGPFSSQAEHGNVRICKGPWNDDYCSCLEEFDGQEKQHDDDADGTSGAFGRLAKYRFESTGAAVHSRQTREV